MNKDVSEGAGDDACTYTYFYRDSCPNCPAVRSYIERRGLPARHYDVNTDEGMREAIRFQVLSTPTVVVADPTGVVRGKYGTVQQLQMALESVAGR